MTFSVDDILKMMRDSKSSFWKIKDMSGTTLFNNMDEKDLTKSCAMIQDKLAAFAGYSQVEVWCGNEGIKNASFKGCQKWIVTSATTSPGVGLAVAPGMVSLGEMDTRLALAALVAKTELDMFKMKMKYQNDSNQLIPDKYAPFLCKMMGMSIEEIKELGMMSAATGTTALAGTEEQNIEITEIEGLMEDLTDPESVGMENMGKLMHALKKNPGAAETILNMIKK